MTEIKSGLIRLFEPRISHFFYRYVLSLEVRTEKHAIERLTCMDGPYAYLRM
jgi:hypothetical protein